MSCQSAGGWIVVGVAHFAEGRCKNLPGGYTKVEPYLDWIKARVGVETDPVVIPTCAQKTQYTSYTSDDICTVLSNDNKAQRPKKRPNGIEKA